MIELMQGSIRLSEELPEVMGYWVDLQSIQLEEAGDTSLWIQAMPLGSYQHPLHGTLRFTPERIKRFADNVNMGVRGQDLDIDYDHKERSGEAAGWVKKAEARSDGLYLLVEWTKEAFEKIKGKAYRYFSPEFVNRWKHPKTGQELTDVLFGGALTNRPFLKDIVPIGLMEAGNPDDQGGDQVDRKTLEALAKRLSVQFDEKTSDEDLSKLVVEAAEKEPEGNEPAPPTQKEPVAASEPADDELKKLAEDNPAIQALLEERKKDQDRIAKLEGTQRLAEVKAQVVSLAEAREGRIIAPKHRGKLEELLVGADKETGDKVVAFLSEFLKDGVVELGERGGNDPESEGGDGSATSEFLTKVKKLTESDKDLSESDAYDQVALAEPDLYNRYRDEAFIS